MDLMLFSLRDEKMKSFGAPFASRQFGEAERHIHSLVNDPKTQISAFPADFTLYHVGTLNDDTGTIIPQNPPNLVCRALDLKRQEPTQ